MLTKDDLRQIGEVMDEKFLTMDKKFDEKFLTMDKKFDEKFLTMDKKFDEKFLTLDEKFLTLDEKFLTLDEKLLTMEERIVDRIIVDVGEAFEQNFLPRVGEMIDEKLAPIQATMVTKSYLDEKMADLKGDLLGYDRKLEKKTDILVDALVEGSALTASDVERLESARVFPRIAR